MTNNEIEIETEEDDHKVTCPKCQKKIYEADAHQCDECGEDNICRDCMVDFEKLSVCKECVDHAYPRKIEKVVYTVPSLTEIKPFNPEEKTEFD
jgi:hypothetical protein